MSHGAGGAPAAAAETLVPRGAAGPGARGLAPPAVVPPGRQGDRRRRRPAFFASLDVPVCDRVQQPSTRLAASVLSRAGVLPAGSRVSHVSAWPRLSMVFGSSTRPCVAECGALVDCVGCPARCHNKLRYLSLRQ